MTEQQVTIPEDTMVNGIPLKQLSTVSQKLFEKLVLLKQEADALTRQYDNKQAVIKELADMILEEVNLVKSASSISE